MDRTRGVCTKGGAQNGSICDAKPCASQRSCVDLVQCGLGSFGLFIHSFIHSQGWARGWRQWGAEQMATLGSLESIGGKVKSESCLVMSDSVTSWTVIVHGILQARILEWVANPFFRGPSQPRDQTQVSHITGGFLTS